MLVSNKELLEYASKAVGIKGHYVEGYGCGNPGYADNHDGILYDLPQGGHRVWNPLKNDGDAFRLVIDLSLRIHVNDDLVMLSWSENEPFDQDIVVECSDDAVAVAREAITRAASIIGRKMK